MSAARMLLAASRSRTLVSQNITVSQTWVCPATTNRIEWLSGNGAAGSPGIPGTPAEYATTQVTAAIVDFYGNDGTANPPAGMTAGNVTWDLMNSTADDARNAINSGAVITNGQLPITCRKVTQYRNQNGESYTLRTETLYTLMNVTPNSARVVRSAGFRYSGAVGSDVRYFTEYAAVEYQYVSSFGTPATPPTTGQSAKAFGQDFPGGTGGGASSTSYGSIPVSPGFGYDISVPPGGNIYITYYY